MEDTKKESTLLHIVSGSSAGLLADSIMHPVDTIRARLQTQSRHQQIYKNTIHAFYTIIRQEGVSSLYKGLPIVAAATVPAHALYFTGYETAKVLIYPNTPQDQKGPGVHFISGAIADFFGTLIWTPMDVVKQRLQVQRSLGTTELKYKGSFHALATILREEGPKGLYRGLFASIVTYGPMSGVYFATYEKLKSYIAELRNSSVSELPFYFHVACGATAGAFAAGVTCPLDVVKTRIQVLSGSSQEYKGTIQAVKTIIKEEGIKGFWKGIGARMLWLGPYCAITISTYEQFKKFYTPLVG